MNTIKKYSKGAIVGFLLTAVIFFSFNMSYKHYRSSYENCLGTLEEQCLTPEGEDVLNLPNRPLCTLGYKEKYKCDTNDKKIYDTLHSIKMTVFEPYGILVFYILGGWIPLLIFGEKSIIAEILLYTIYFIPFILIGMFIQYLIKKFRK